MNETPKTAPTKRGQLIEQQTAQWLTARGIRLLTANFRSRFGEIDIIGRDGDFIVFFEVRYRRHQHFGGAAPSVDYRKQKKLLKTASFYYLRNPGAAKCPARFDVIAVSHNNNALEFTWHKAAFTSTDIYPDAF